MAQLNASTLPLYCFSVWLVVYIMRFVVRGVYRLYLSPLARKGIPGPKIAAITSWTESYYQICVGEGGLLHWQIEKWHDEYGPIIRIGPNEVHIRDSEFYDFIHANSKRPPYKLESEKWRFNTPRSVHSAEDPAYHRRRRAPLNPFYSKPHVASRNDFVQKIWERLSFRFQKEFAGTDKILTMMQIFACCTGDAILHATLGEDFELTQYPNFRSGWTIVMLELAGTIHWIDAMPWTLKLSLSLPESVVTALNPMVGHVIKCRGMIKEEIKIALADKENYIKRKPDTMLSALIQWNLKEELTLAHLDDELMSTIGGGTETTARALTVATFHILNNPECHQRLKNELKEAIPDPSKIPEWAALERLPYLTACITEALRMTYGIFQRTSRHFPAPTVYDKYELPPWTVISMSNYFTVHDEAIFPSSYEYRPSRWLPDPVTGEHAKAPNGKPLSGYMLAFAKGPRMCLGFQMAYAELYTGLAYLFRRFDLELFDTKRDAVDAYMDRFMARPKPGTKGVRIKLRMAADM